MRFILFALLLTISAPSFVPDADAQTKTRVRFPAGTSSTAVKGSIRGYAYRDYIVRGSADQTIAVAIDSRNTYTVLSVFRPDGESLDGAAQTDEFTGPLPVTGDYLVRIAMMRAGARRRGAVSNFTLKISID